MATAGEIRITVYRGLQYRATLKALQSTHAVLQWNDDSVTAFAVLLNNPDLGELMHPQARGILHFRRSWEDPWEFGSSGKITKVTGEGFQMLGYAGFTLEDDFRIFHNWLGWPNPTGTLAQQGDDKAYDTRTGNAEAILKSFTQSTITRLGLGSRYTVATNRDRGATIPGGVSMRFHPLADRLFPAVSDAGIGVTVRQTGESPLVIDCYTPTVVSQVLTESAGVLTYSKWSSEAPTATRAIIGGGGEGTARVFRQVQNAPLETEWDDVVEVFQDARDTSVATVMDERGNQALVDGRPVVGINPTLSETENFRFGGPGGFSLGSKVTFQTQIGLTVTDVIRAVTIDSTAERPFKATPSVGTQDDNDYMPYARAIAALAKNIRNLEAGR